MARLQTDILIVGGGLAGLRLADLLIATGRDVQLVEARNRLGGRILNGTFMGASFDLGPAWFWPGQPRMAKLVRQLGVEVFEQYSQGDARFEDTQRRLQQGHGIVSMQGSFRVSGGLGALVDGLAAKLPSDRLHLNAALLRLEHKANGITATLQDKSVVEASQVVLAVPPRVAAELAFAPALPPHALQTMRSTPTWMAGHAKVVLIYDQPFWRRTGLSGDAMSQIGPMVEIHDASPVDGKLGALFGFIGVPPARRQETPALISAVKAQATRLFGPEAPAPQEILLQDWAKEPFTTTSDDLAPLTAHPRYGPPSALQDLWEGRLHFGNTEVAAQFGGYLEGALEAAEQVCADLTTQQPLVLRS